MTLWCLQRCPPQRFDSGDGRTEIAFIAAGTHHSVAVSRNNGVLWTWGASRAGQLGHGSALVRHCVPIPTAVPTTTFGETIVSASAMLTSTMAVTASGVLWASGRSRHGALGLGLTKECHTFNRVGGAEYFGNGGVRSVACALYHTLIVAQDGMLWVCGHSQSYCLGIYTDRCRIYERPEPMHPALFNYEPVLAVSASEKHSAAVTRSGGLYTWGAERSGEVGGLCVPHVPSENAQAIFQYAPQRVMHTGVPNEDIDPFGLWNCPLSAEEQQAFAMCTHLHLGDNSPYHQTDDGILECILRYSRRVPALVQNNVGLRNLLGL